MPHRTKLRSHVSPVDFHNARGKEKVRIRLVAGPRDWALYGRVSL